MVTAQVERGAIGALSTEAIKVCQFLKKGPLTFNRVNAEEDPQGFLDDIEKIFYFIHATNIESVEFAAYQLKDVAYQWYKEWDQSKGDDAELALWNFFV